MSDNPWESLAPPSAADAINARRVSSEISLGIFWALDINRKRLLVLQHAEDSTPQGHLPKLQGIEVAVSKSHGTGGSMLVFRLLDSAHQDIFYRLCKDIIASASAATSEKEAIAIAIARTWRWHHLLRGGRDDRLSPEEQKGLIGELLVMERYLLTLFSASDVVSSWRGPMGAPKDFEIGRVCIESKARRGAAKPFIEINSEHQLDTGGVDAIFLYVVELDMVPSDMREGFTLPEVVRRISGRIALADNAATFRFEELLASAGFRWDDDYSDSLWLEGASHLYQVSDNFPRIAASGVANGVSNVRYSISLAECESHAVTSSVLSSALRG